MFTFRSIPVRWLAMAVTAVAGCGGPNYTPAKPADPVLARQTLSTALDRWRSGSRSDELARQKPEIYVGDEDWSAGKVLKRYQLLGDGERYGNSMRFQVRLELAEEPGEASQTDARYIVATSPVRSVTRDDGID